MQTYTITDPNGVERSIDGPEGATREQVIDAIQHRLGTQPAASTNRGEDPDKAGIAQKQRIIDLASQYVDDARAHPLKTELQTLAGPGEAALNMASGIGSSAVGGLSALGSIIKSGVENQYRNGLHVPTSDEFDAAMGKAADTSQDVQRAGTYQPRGAAGKMLSEVASVPLNAASAMTRSVGGDVGQFIGGDKGRIAGEDIGGAIPAIVGTLQGGAAALRGVRGVPDITMEDPALNRRADPQNRLRVDQMTPDEMRQSLLTSDLTGLPNKRAFQEHVEANPQNNVLYGDLDDFKSLNSKYGHDGADQILAGVGDIKAKIADEMGVNPFHRSGDEFLATHPDSATLNAYGKSLQDELAGATFEITKPDGTTVEHQGVGFSYGTDKNAKLAELSSDIQKAERKQLGLRTGQRDAVENVERGGQGNENNAAGWNGYPGQEPGLTSSDSAANQPTLYNLTKQTEGGNLPSSDQTARAQTLQRIGMSHARESAISGNSAEGATQAQIAKFTESPAGLAAKDMFDSERTALQDHAKSIVQDTGGSIGMDNSTLNARGQIIAAPFDGLRKYFDDATSKLYQAADEASNGKPTTSLDGLKELINTESQFAGKAANGSLGNGIKSYMREQGIMDKDGNLSPVTPQQAEGLKQYINSQWSPETSGLAGKIKGVIDDDVFKGAGADVYAEARNMYKMKKATLDNPSGVSKLMDYDPQTPINRATSFEKIPDTLTRLPVAQFGHVVDVLNKILDPQYDTPEALQLQAHDALNEIKGHMANSLMEAGDTYATKWNPKGVTQYLKNNSAKFPMVFSDAELAKISDLNDAGHILSVDKSYPGAAAQGALAVKRGLLPSIVSKGLAGVGGLTGSVVGPLGTAAGAAVGSAAGDAVAANIGGSAAIKRFNQGIVDLNERANPKTAAPAPTSEVARIQAIIEAAKEAQKQKNIEQLRKAALYAPTVYANPVNTSNIAKQLLDSSDTSNIIKDALQAVNGSGLFGNNGIINSVQNQ